MSPQTDNSEQTPYFILTDEEADRLVIETLDSDSEPEPLVRLLLKLFDNAEESQLQAAIYQLMKVAYDCSLVHSADFQDYLQAIRQGQNPVEEARTRLSSSQNPDA